MAITFQQFDGPPVFIVSRVCLSLAEARAAEAALNAMPAASAYLPNPAPSEAPPLSPVAAELIERGDEEAPTAHLKAGEAAQ